MSSNRNINTNKELISERSQANKLVPQNEIISNNDLLKLDQNHYNMEDQTNLNTIKKSSFEIDAIEL